MLAPKRVKYRKPQKSTMRGMSMTGDYVSFGTYGLKAIEAGWITSRQIEAARISISRRVKKIGKLWIRIFHINRLPKNQQRLVWVKVKVLQNIGLQW